jgi:hypothetical protein
VTLAASSCKARHPGANPADLAVCYALGQTGKPYVWGATGPDSYDCSGLTQAAYEYAGVTLPRTSQYQCIFGKAIGSLADALPGDLIFPYADESHVVMYLGGDQIVEAPRTGVPVQVVKVYGTAGGIRRPTAAGGTGATVAADTVTTATTTTKAGSDPTGLSNSVSTIIAALTSPGDWTSFGYIVGGVVILLLVVLSTMSGPAAAALGKAGLA